MLPSHPASTRQPPLLHTSHSFSPDSLNHDALSSTSNIASTPREFHPARGRPGATSAASIRPPPSQSTRAQSAQRAQPELVTGRTAPPDNGLQRKTSNSYGHHRQTSVIHGVQHSRNPSFNSGSSAGPLSPESLANALGGPKQQGLNRSAESRSNVTSPASDGRDLRGHPQSSSLSGGVGVDGTSTTHANGYGHVKRPTVGARHRRPMGQGNASSQGPQEVRTPGEYALHHLFNSFVQHADQKINLCITNMDSMATPVEHTCGPGVDPAFDQLIAALGHVARSTPKPLVDSLMLWRKAKGDIASAARKHMQQQNSINPHPGLPIALPRRNTEPVHVNVARHGQAAEGVEPQNAPSAAEEYSLTDRRATISVYLLCRVLVEIFAQSSLEEITPDLAKKLEDIVFTQLRDVDPVQIMSSSIRLANWRIYGQVLGQMSSIDFVEVTSRFVTELDQCQHDIARNPGSTAAKDAENRAELLILGMRYIQVKSGYCWQASLDFLRNIGSLFVSSHGPRIKQAYCQVFERLLLPLAADPDANLNGPRWREFIEMTNSRLNQMLTKVRHWTAGFPLSIMLLCVSPLESLASHWMTSIHGLVAKLKDRSTRGLIMHAICRLTWSYLSRVADPPGMRTRKLEELIRLVLPVGKRAYLSPEPSMAEPLIHFIRIIGFANQDLCFRQVIFPLVNADLFLSSKEPSIEQMEPEKIALGIRALLYVVEDLEKGEAGKPQFPLVLPSVQVVETLPTSPIPAKTRLFGDISSSNTFKDVVTSYPVDATKLSDASSQYYHQFCDILGRITLTCDKVFGGQATLTEKLSSLPTPKTPLVDAFAFSRREDGVPVDSKQYFYDLLHVAIQALPRCLSEHITTPHLHLLCTGSAHVQPAIATSSAQSLKAIAAHGHAQAVAVTFPQFIFEYDKNYSTLSDEGMLGPGHIETTLTLYLDLLHIWLAELQQKTASTNVVASAGNRGLRAGALELTNVYPHVDEIEAYGFFFLCSQSWRVRGYAVKVLRLVRDFDQTLGQQDSARIINILEHESARILKIKDDVLTVAERSRLQKDRRRANNQHTLIEICSSEMHYDSSLWVKVIPNLTRSIFDSCPNVVALCRGWISDRLAELTTPVVHIANMSRAALNDFRSTNNHALSTPPDILVEQWKIYLIVACVTLSGPGAQSQSQLANAVHSRKGSKNTGTSGRMVSAREILSVTISLLGVSSEHIRSAVVLALSAINRKLYRTLLESLQYAVINCNDEAKNRNITHQRTPSSPQRSREATRLRTEITHLYKLTCTFLRDEQISRDEWILNNLVTYTRDLRIFLSDTDVQHHEPEYQRLRIHYCGLIEELFEGVNRTSTPSRWMPFESRKSAFTLMEEWCGFSPSSTHYTVKADHAPSNSVPAVYDGDERMGTNVAIEIERKNLRLASLSAMAALCAGPISLRTESGTLLSFQLPRIHSWIDSIFATATDRMHIIGRRALKSLILHNRGELYLLDHTIDCCYTAESLKALDSYFTVIADVLIENTKYPYQYWRILGVVLFTLGNETRDVRMRSAQLLRILDERQQNSSKLQDFDIRISDKTTAVYKKAQFEYSRRLAQAHPEIAFTLFSEFSLHFKYVGQDAQRNMVAAILPWLQTVELQVDENGGPTGVSYMLLSNMFEITIQSSTVLHNEIQALWQALATGPHPGNVQLILDFIIHQSLTRREQNFVEYAKQVVVYLSFSSPSTNIDALVVEFFLQQLTPKTMVTDKRASEHIIPDTEGLPYVADLTALLPAGHKQAGLSLGQVALIFLVDLLVADVEPSRQNAVKLIHVVLILWDHYIASVQEQAREMLVHLIHLLVTAKVSEDLTTTLSPRIQKLVEAIRSNDDSVTWSYEENNDRSQGHVGNRVPDAMAYLCLEIMEIFEATYGTIEDSWAREALQWASTCPVRHMACRSFQVFRCVSRSIDGSMLADMLARLSNTISDEQSDYQTFSMEIMTTLRVNIAAMDSQALLRHPQLFWTTCACLGTIHEREYFEALGMLEKILDRVDLGETHVLKVLIKAKPANWEGIFDGIQSLLYKGLRSADCLDRSLALLHQCAGLPDNELLGDSTRLSMNVLANLPRFLHQIEQSTIEQKAIECASKLSQVALLQKCPEVSQQLNEFARLRLSTSQDFLRHMISAVVASFFPQFDAQSLIFLIGLLTNQTKWFRVKVLEILCQIIPRVNMKQSTITCHGPDLISPLLRLLQTDLCSLALQVMDQIMEVSGNPMERHHMRMSMAFGPARAIRKEYERTQSLYGIPMASGWSVPMPAVQSAETRNNVHQVYFTCGDETEQDEKAATPEFDIQEDEPDRASFFEMAAGDEHFNVEDTTTEANLGELVERLDSLDDFFNDTEEDDTDATTVIGTPSFSSADLTEHGSRIYDQHTAPILQKSLARTNSTSSFQNGLVESRPQTSHRHYGQPSISMTPEAFTSSPMSSFGSMDDLGGPGPSLPNSTKKSHLNPMLARPGMHSRSITSPANNFPLSQPTSAPYVPPNEHMPSFNSDPVNDMPSSTNGSYQHHQHVSSMSSDAENVPFPALSLSTSNPIYHNNPQSGPGPSLPNSAHIYQRTTPTSADSTNGPFSFDNVRRGVRRLTGGKSESAKERERIRDIARARGVSGSQHALPGSASGPGPSLAQSVLHSPKVPRVPLEYLMNSNNTNPIYPSINASNNYAASPANSP